MHFSIHNRRLLRGITAGAVALAGASACSRSDRTTAGWDSTQTGAVAPADTQANASAQSSTTAQPTTEAQPSSQPSSADTTNTAKPSAGNAKAPTARRTTKPADRSAVGYKPMGQDSSATRGGRDTVAAAAAVPDTSTPADTAATEMAGAAAGDTANAGVAPMARDTSVTLAQGDTSAQAQVDTSSQAPADTATIGDTGVILTRADTAQQPADTAQRTADTTQQAAVAVGDSTAGHPVERVHPDTVAEKADELAKHEPARVRPPEDSTEVLGKVTTDSAGANPKADATAVGAAGVASTGNIATGADAVALLSRQGERCIVAASDQNRDVLWDMASSPTTLNPCGTGTMTLPRIWTGEKK